MTETATSVVALCRAVGNAVLCRSGGGAAEAKGKLARFAYAVGFLGDERPPLTLLFHERAFVESRPPSQHAFLCAWVRTRMFRDILRQALVRGAEADERCCDEKGVVV